MAADPDITEFLRASRSYMHIEALGRDWETFFVNSISGQTNRDAAEAFRRGFAKSVLGHLASDDYETWTAWTFDTDAEFREHLWKYWRLFYGEDEPSACASRRSTMGMSYENAFAALQESGWTVSESARPWVIPSVIRTRYGWVPAPIWDVLCEMDEIVAPDEMSWFLTGRDYCGESVSAYAWNEWERQSLEAAVGDEEWACGVRSFWGNHFPLATSVRTGYAYLALARKGLGVVSGEEPDFEEVSLVAGSVDEFLDLLARRDGSFCF